MAFGAIHYPGAVTFGWLIDNGMDVGLHCHPCDCHIAVPVRFFAVRARYERQRQRTLQVRALRITKANVRNCHPDPSLVDQSRRRARKASRQSRVTGS